MTRRSSQPRPLRDAVSSVLKRLDNEQNLRAYEVWTFWDEEVGEAMACRAQPSQFRNGLLIVTVSSHAWLQEMQFLKDDLLERLNRHLGMEVIRDLYFVSGRVRRNKPPSDDPMPEPQLVEVPAIPELAGIDDPQLAQAFRRLAEARARRLVRQAGRKPSKR